MLFCLASHPYSHPLPRLGSDDDEEDADGEEDEEDGFVVPNGYLSDDEVDSDDEEARGRQDRGDLGTRVRSAFSAKAPILTCLF